MFFGRLLGRQLSKAEHFDSTFSKGVINLGNPCKEKSTNTTPAKESDLTILQHYTTLKYLKKNSRHARQEEQVANFNEMAQKLRPQEDLAEAAPALRHVDAETLKNPLQKINHAFVILYEPWRTKSAKSELLKTAYLFVDALLVTWGAVKQQLLARYVKSGFLASGRKYDKLDASCAKREAEFVSFLHSQTTAYQVAKNAREAGFGGSVILAFDTDFEDMVADAKPTFVMFYASFCDHCVVAKPAYSKLATTLKGEGKMKAIAIDAADNPKVADLAGIQTLPTFKMYKAGKVVEEYTGERSYEEFLKFCKSHA